jgi:hypothetical protein
MEKNKEKETKTKKKVEKENKNEEEFISIILEKEEEDSPEKETQEEKNKKILEQLSRNFKQQQTALKILNQLSQAKSTQEKKEQLEEIQRKDNSSGSLVSRVAGEKRNFQEREKIKQDYLTKKNKNNPEYSVMGDYSEQGTRYETNEPPITRNSTNRPRIENPEKRNIGKNLEENYVTNSLSRFEKENQILNEDRKNLPFEKERKYKEL